VNQLWLPKSVLLLRTYSRDALAADLLAGVTVGLVALPLAMAFVISSGVAPQSGLYCAIVAGFLISALGGSRSARSAVPTGAFVVVVSQIHRSGRELILCGALPQPAALMEQAEFHEHVGGRNICPSIEAALERAAEIHDIVFGQEK